MNHGSFAREMSSHLAANNAATDDRGHILAIIPRGEVLRNFEYSGTFAEVARHARLSLLTVLPNEDLVRDLRAKYDAVHPLTEVTEAWPVRFQRELLDVAHGKWLWSKAAQERWRIRDAEAVTTRQKAIRLLKKSLAMPLSNGPGLRVLNRSERTASRWLNADNSYRDLYKNLKPSLVFNGSHIHSRNAIHAVQTAQWMGIPTATFIFSWDNLTSQGRITLPYDYFLVWNEQLRDQLLDMYPWIKPENVFVTGTPQFDHHFREEYYLDRTEFCRSVGADPARPIVLYSTGMPNHMPDEPWIVESIADILLDFQEAERPQLLVRVYAKDRTGRFDEMKQRRPDILFQPVHWDADWHTPRREDAYGLTNAIRHCSLGINIASTISLELCMFDKPVINVAFDAPNANKLGLRNEIFYDFDHYKPVVDSGAVELAKSPTEMRTLVRQCLQDPTRRSGERKEFLSKMFGQTLDGRSANRVSEALLTKSPSAN